MTRRFVTFVTILIVLVAAVASCGFDPRDKYVITFEDVVLGEEGYIDNASYVEQGVEFENYVDQYGDTFGFVVSNRNDCETPGYNNRFSVHDKGGANGSQNFAVFNPHSKRQLDIRLEKGLDCEIVSAYFCLTTYTYLTVTEGDDGGYFNARKFDNEHKDHLMLTIKGYNSKNNQTGFLTVDLADYRGVEPYVYDSWRYVSLSTLGKVNRLEFWFTCTDENTPIYVAIDNIEFVSPEEQL